LFEPTDEGSRFDHFLVQAREVVTGSREGGFFIMIGHKPAGAAASAMNGGANGAVQAGSKAESREVIHA
jgi:hypothetical protein